MTSLNAIVLMASLPSVLSGEADLVRRIFGGTAVHLDAIYVFALCADGYFTQSFAATGPARILLSVHSV